MGPGTITVNVTNDSGYRATLFTKILANATWVRSPTDIPNDVSNVFQAKSIIDNIGCTGTVEYIVQNPNKDKFTVNFVWNVPGNNSVAFDAPEGLTITYFPSSDITMEMNSVDGR
ncbi:hypothetical protein Q9L58_001950 [Maublancomyces gigas]|uniref:Uncharacterized protein n=1 Tax=Discina gigas TaxID=1032678 RepID=A0ABR3GTB9_9PEZI